MSAGFNITSPEQEIALLRNSLKAVNKRVERLRQGRLDDALDKTNLQTRVERLERKLEQAYQDARVEIDLGNRKSRIIKILREQLEEKEGDE